MTERVTPELVPGGRTIETARTTDPTPSVRIDFASVFREHLLVYGWILGLFKWVARAEIRHGEVVIDLMSLAIPVPRPDVTQHFAAVAPHDDDNHGFCLLVALPEAATRPSYLRLAVVMHSGEAIERVWPVGTGDAPVIAFFQENRGTLYWLLQHLPPPEALRLREVSAPGDLPARPERAPLALQLQFGVDGCVLVEQRILVVWGWLNERDRPLTAAKVTVGHATLELLPNMAFTARPAAEAGAPATLRGESGPRLNFTLIAALPGAVAAAGEAIFELAAGQRQMRVRRALGGPAAARDELAALWRRIDPDAAIGGIEGIAALLDESAAPAAFDWLSAEQAAAVERLPASLQCASPQYFLHLDGIIPVAEQGVYLSGWFRAAGAIARVAYHGGFTQRRIDDHWVRQPRLDVTKHLAALGVAATEHDHGFAVYVPLPTKREPVFLAVTTTSGEVRRARLPVAAAARAQDTVRSLLTSFHLPQRAVRRLLDEHIGPAVETAWGDRPRSTPTVTTERFGPAPAAPGLSILVPLFGRWDLAEVQMALFADDPDFEKLELIYFVDDPSIYDEFRAQCADLYEIYRVPFTLAHAGVNLGFAGANNRAASVAAGRLLLLLNSDVFPARPGWASELLRIHAGLDKPGVLGAKLLYEDGSVQHAGMEFRRHAPWGDLWLNEHVQKGQSGAGLTGLRRAAAVTAACALIDADLYRRLGGLSEEYIIGDFEDSDLCLRAAAAGRENWVALDVALYHLERQSQDRIGSANWRENLTLYNAWRHHKLWAAHIEAAAP